MNFEARNHKTFKINIGEMCAYVNSSPGESWRCWKIEKIQLKFERKKNRISWEDFLQILRRKKTVIKSTFLGEELAPEIVFWWKTRENRERRTNVSICSEQVFRSPRFLNWIENKQKLKTLVTSGDIEFVLNFITRKMLVHDCIINSSEIEEVHHLDVHCKAGNEMKRSKEKWIYLVLRNSRRDPYN